MALVVYEEVIIPPGADVIEGFCGGRVEGRLEYVERQGGDFTVEGVCQYRTGSESERVLNPGARKRIPDPLVPGPGGTVKPPLRYSSIRSAPASLYPMP